MPNSSCPLCNQAIRVPRNLNEVQAYARHFNHDCKGRSRRPQ